MIYVSKDVPERVREELGAQYLRIKPLAAAERMWERLLTPRERKQLGDDLVGAFEVLGTVGIWEKVRGGSPARAVIEVAYGIGFLDQTSRDWLIREIGERGTRSSQTSDRPTWDRTNGELRFRGEVIRKVRMLKNPSNIQHIIDAFERSKWKPQIETPPAFDQQRLHQTLFFLNEHVTRIRFHSTNGAKLITWEAR
jgi:hypothetical protein